MPTASANFPAHLVTLDFTFWDINNGIDWKINAAPKSMSNRKYPRLCSTLVVGTFEGRKESQISCAIAARANKMAITLNAANFIGGLPIYLVGGRREASDRMPPG
jgi:hypothetical protein